MDSCKVNLQIGVNHLIVEGPEAFVATILESWGPKLTANVSAQPLGPGPSAQSSPDSPSLKHGSLSQYENVFDSADGKMKIICHVPGSNNAATTRNAALIYLYGKLLEGVESVPSEEIRQTCVDQGCYDSTNFAQYLKGLKSSIVMNTKPGGGYDVKLTAPGRKAAKELVESLNNGAA